MSETIHWTHLDGSLASLQAGVGPRIVFVHGFTQTGTSWGHVAETFTGDHHVTLIDAPGHGRSTAIRADLSRGADLIAEVGGPALYVGYSMGARFVLHVALAHPQLLHGLVLLGGTAGLVTERERIERRAADDALAAQIEADGVGEFLRRWLASPLFATLPDDAKGLDDRSTNTSAGLASSLRLAGLGTQRPLWDQLSTIAAPTLVMAGDLDSKFSALGRQMADAIGANASFRAIEAAGHAAHLEHPAAVVSTMREWMTLHGLNPRTETAGRR